VSLPLHWTDDGLPVGVMLAARPAEEELLLSVAAQVETAAPWDDRRPPGW
jgi:amidase